jgi:hypothetical protein
MSGNSILAFLLFAAILGFFFWGAYHLGTDWGARDLERYQNATSSDPTNVRAIERAGTIKELLEDPN